MSFTTRSGDFGPRFDVVTLDMPVVNQPEVMIGNVSQRFDPDGRLTDEPTRQFIQKLLGALVQLAKSSPTSKSQTG